MEVKKLFSEGNPVRRCTDGDIVDMYLDGLPFKWIAMRVRECYPYLTKGEAARRVYEVLVENWKDLPDGLGGPDTAP